MSLKKILIFVIIVLLIEFAVLGYYLLKPQNERSFSDPEDFAIVVTSEINGIFAEIVDDARIKELVKKHNIFSEGGVSLIGSTERQTVKSLRIVLVNKSDYDFFDQHLTPQEQLISSIFAEVSDDQLNLLLYINKDQVSTKDVNWWSSYIAFLVDRGVFMSSSKRRSMSVGEREDYLRSTYSLLSSGYYSSIFSVIKAD